MVSVTWHGRWDGDSGGEAECVVRGGVTLVAGGGGGSGGVGFGRTLGLLLGCGGRGQSPWGGLAGGGPCRAMPLLEPFRGCGGQRSPVLVGGSWMESAATSRYCWAMVGGLVGPQSWGIWLGGGCPAFVITSWAGTNWCLPSLGAVGVGAGSLGALGGHGTCKVASLWGRG